MTEITCSAPECTRKVYAKGLCNKHYNQLRTHGELTPELEREEYSSGGKVCKEHGCVGIVVAKGMCRAHYQQQYRMSEHDNQIEDKMKESEPAKPKRRRVVRRRRRLA